LRHSVDVVLMQTAFHARADPREVAQLEAAERGGEDVRRECDQAVGFIHVRGDFCEVAIRGESDGAAEGVPDAIANGLLDGAREIEGVEERLFAAHQVHSHFVDRLHR